MEQYFLISYDITDSKLRGFFFRRLKKIAVHLQKSVFMYEGNIERVAKIEEEFKKRLTSEDNVLIMPCSRSSYMNARIYSGKKPVKVLI